MLRALLGRGDQPQQLLLHRTRRHHIGQRRLALGERAGLVEHDRRDARDILQCRGILDQDVVPGANAGADRDRRRGRQAQRIGAGDHHRRDRECQRGNRGGAAEEIPDDEGDDARAHRQNDQILRGPVGQPLPRRLGALRLLHQVHDLRQGGVGADLGRAEAHAAAAVDRAGDHGVARPLGDRHALAGDQRLVDAGLALGDLAVNRHLVARLEHDDVVDLHVAARNREFLAIAQHRRLGRHQVEQRAQRLVGAAPRAHLHPVAEQHERHQHRRGLKEGLAAEERDQHAEHIRRQHAGRDQHAHVEHARVAAIGRRRQ